MTDTNKNTEKQIDKFKRVSRELETDESEAAFNGILKKIAKTPPPKDNKNEGEGDMR